MSQLIRVPSISNIATRFAAVALGAVCLSAISHAQAPSPEVTGRLKGGWQLNREQSTIPPEPMAMRAAPPAGPGRGRGAAGITTGDGRDAQAPPPSPETLLVRATWREIQPPASTLYINVLATEVVLTNETGTIRRFTTDGQRQPLVLGESKAETRTSWTPSGVLSQDMVGGPLKIARKWTVSEQGNQLIVTVLFEGGLDRTGQGQPMMLVYERR